MMVKESPSFEREAELIKAGFHSIAGIDEAGRGPLAGPVVTAAVILDPSALPDGLNDSKKLSEKKREALYEEISTSAQVSIAIASARTIDQLNIRAATLAAMTKAVKSLAQQADFALIDGRDTPPDFPIKAEALVKGDSRSVSIAAASIIAKVTRDRIMTNTARLYPIYGFDRHKGYGSALHRSLIVIHGPCPLHRESFEPIKSLIVKEKAPVKPEL